MGEGNVAKFVFDVTFTVDMPRQGDSEDAAFHLMQAIKDAEYYPHAIVEYVNLEGGEEVEE